MPKDFPIRIAEDNSAAIAQAEAGLAHIRNMLFGCDFFSNSFLIKKSSLCILPPMSSLRIL